MGDLIIPSVARNPGNVGNNHTREGMNNVTPWRSGAYNLQELFEVQASLVSVAQFVFQDRQPLKEPEVSRRHRQALFAEVPCCLLITHRMAQDHFVMERGG